MALFVSYVAFAVVCDALDQPNKSSYKFNYTTQISEFISDGVSALVSYQLITLKVPWNSSRRMIPFN